MICENPKAFYLLLLLIPAILFVIYKNKKNSFYIKQNFKVHKAFGSTMRIFNYRKFIFIRSFLLSIAWIMLVLSFSGLYWGTNLIPVQKTGTSVSLVFDISNSMMAEDGPGNINRLKAAGIYANKLLDKIEEHNMATPVSVILAKGDGITAIPITEDYTAIRSLIEVMNPMLVSVPGTSIGKGVAKAKDSFPSNYSSAGRIWVFTDGEETDGYLKNSLIDSIKSGIPVTIIGFGKEEETKVLAGDGVTYINSALRKNKILGTMAEAEKATLSFKDQTPISFIDSRETGSAVKLLSQLKTNDGQIIAYEAKPKPRFKLFLFLAVIFFALGYLFMEFDISRLKSDGKKASKLMIFCLFSLIFTSCSRNTSKILEGTFAYHQKQYGTAVSCYLDIVKESSKNQDIKLQSYSLYDLGTAYSKLEEDEAALDKFSQVSDQAPDNIRYAAFYNAGVILSKNGQYEEAQEYFRKALNIDSSKVNAKVNLEITIQKAMSEKIQTNQPQAKSSPISKEEEDPVPDMQEAVFERIKENDQNKWKNSQQPQNQNSAEDY